MLDRNRGRLVGGALALSLAMSPFAMADTATAQVRSDLQTRARVVEAGAAWTAHHRVERAVKEAVEVVSITDGSSDPVRVTEGGVPEGSVPSPRVSVLDRSEAASSDRGAVVPNDARSARAPGPVRKPGGPAISALSAASGPESAAGRSPEGSRVLIVTVEHVAN